MDLPKKLKNKNAMIIVQNRDNQCLRWAIRAALFPPKIGKKVTRTEVPRIMTKAPHVTSKALHIITKVSRIMTKAPHIIRKAVHII